jgi:hypothetical protein
VGDNHRQRQSMGSADTADTDCVNNAMVNHVTVKARDMLKDDIAKILITRMGKHDTKPARRSHRIQRMS